MGAVALSTQDRKKLRTLEDTIDRGLGAFVEVGNALAEIRAGELFVELDETFEGYCKKRFNIAKSRAYQLIDAAAVVKAVSTIGGNVAPANERQARILAELETPQQQADVWAKAIESAPPGHDGKPKVTAAIVRKAAEQILSPAAACPNCGGAEFDSDGDCAACYEPPADPAPEPVRVFANLASLPPDVSDAFESFKLCILRHRLSGWADISRGDLIEALKALGEFAKVTE